MKPTKLILSTKMSLKCSNIHKLQSLNKLNSEAVRVINLLIDVLWPMTKLPAVKPGSDVTSQVTDSWLSARMIQVCAAHASSIVRGTKAKQEKRKYMISKLMADGKHKEASRLQRYTSAVTMSQPVITAIDLELDSRFFSLEFGVTTTIFDGWLTLSSLVKRGYDGSVSRKMNLPFKLTKHFRKMLLAGQINLSSVRVGLTTFSVSFEMNVPANAGTDSIGIDLGQTAIFSCSDDSSISDCPHGHSMKSICDKLARKKKGSKAFKRAELHRSNFIGWSINQLNLSTVSKVFRESLRHVRHGRNTSRSLKHWNYDEIVSRLDRKLALLNVSVTLVNPTYTSQRCSSCGWVRKSNRKGKMFKCTHCGFSHDADLNAARNIALLLQPISAATRRKQLNRTGFFWYADGQEPIVPVTQRTENE